MLQAMWVHGTSVMPERTAASDLGDTWGPLTDIAGVPWSSKVGLRQGFGATFRGRDGARNWFHFSIPTPVIHNDERANLLRVFVLYQTDPQVTVVNVHVFDGPDRIFATVPPSGTSGDHSRRLQEGFTRFTVPDQPPVERGLGISVEVLFTDMGNIQFVTAGADFDVTRGR